MTDVLGVGFWEDWRRETSVAAALGIVYIEVCSVDAILDDHRVNTDV
jgi:hypothetical protein